MRGYVVFADPEPMETNEGNHPYQQELLSGIRVLQPRLKRQFLMRAKHVQQDITKHKGESEDVMNVQEEHSVMILNTVKFAL